MQTINYVTRTTESRFNLLAVMLSIHPYYCQQISAGWKWIEIRKNKPKIKLPFKGYIYCTKPNTTDPNLYLEIHSSDGKINKGNGQVIGEFICDKIEELNFDALYMAYMQRESFDNKSPLTSQKMVDEEFLPGTCVSYKEAMQYCKNMHFNGENSEVFYGWHMSELKIYDKPKKLSDFYNYCYSGCDKCEYKSWDYSYAGDCKELICTVSNKKPLTRPPQSWFYVKPLEEYEKV